MSADSLSFAPMSRCSELSTASGRGLKTLLRRGFDLPNIDNPLVHQPKYFVCGQGQDPKHQTGHHLRCSTDPYHPPSEFIF